MGNLLRFVSVVFWIQFSLSKFLIHRHYHTCVRTHVQMITHTLKPFPLCRRTFLLLLAVHHFTANFWQPVSFMQFLKATLVTMTHSLTLTFVDKYATRECFLCILTSLHIELTPQRK